MGKWNYGIVDFDEEISSVGVPMVNLTAVNFAAQVALITALQAAIDDIIIGTPRQYQLIAVTDAIAGVLPTDAYAQRETKWLVKGRDASGFASQIEIPTAKLGITGFSGGQLSITSTLGAALKDALDAVWMSPRSGTAVEVESIYHVGRNI